jgi:hypothetical protein
LDAVSSPHFLCRIARGEDTAFPPIGNPPQNFPKFEPERQRKYALLAHKKSAEVVFIQIVFMQTGMCRTKTTSPTTVKFV